MKSREECEKILGGELLKKIENTLKAKSIDEHTTMRVVDYLALHKLAFPYVDINSVLVKTNAITSIAPTDVAFEENLHTVQEPFQLSLPSFSAAYLS